MLDGYYSVYNWQHSTDAGMALWVLVGCGNNGMVPSRRWPVTLLLCVGPAVEAQGSSSSTVSNRSGSVQLLVGAR
jgi:hypothetical protein